MGVASRKSHPTPAAAPVKPESARAEDDVDATEGAELLLRELGSSANGLSSAEAERRLLQHGPNELRKRREVTWPRELARQLTYPLALLLWVASGLSFAIGSYTIAIAILLIIFLNAAFAMAQERQAANA